MGTSIACMVHVASDTPVAVRTLGSTPEDFTSVAIGGCSLIIPNIADARRLADKLNAHLVISGVSDWQPVQTAPRGVSVLVVLSATPANATYGSEGRSSVHQAAFEDGKWDDLENAAWKVTHWMPLPQAPAAALANMQVAA